MADDAHRCQSCGLVINSDSDRVVIDGHAFHTECAIEDPPPTRGGRLGRLAHWANSLGWGQG